MYMTVTELIDVDPMLGSKILDDMDFNEIRGDDRELMMKWIEKALLIESTLFLLRNSILDVTGIRKYDNGCEPTFRFKGGDDFRNLTPDEGE